MVEVTQQRCDGLVDMLRHMNAECKSGTILQMWVSEHSIRSNISDVLFEMNLFVWTFCDILTLFSFSANKCSKRQYLCLESCCQ